MNLGNFIGAPFQGGGSLAAPLSAGYYFIINAASTTPSPVSAFVNSSTKFDDGSVGDHTTSESSTAAGNTIIQVLRVLPSIQTIQSYTSEIWSETPLVDIYYSTDGIAWTLWESPLLSGGVTHGWITANGDPADKSAKYVLMVFKDSSSLDPPAVARVGDFRIT